jgi:hypothetical protein
MELLDQDSDDERQNFFSNTSTASTRWSSSLAEEIFKRDKDRSSAKNAISRKSGVSRNNFLVSRRGKAEKSVDPSSRLRL